MTSNISVLVIARGGSKGLDRKNLRKLSNHSLVQISVMQGFNFTEPEKVYCSTEDQEIKDNVNGLCKIIDRPSELALDTTVNLEVIRHALEVIQSDWTILLQPTNPFRDCQFLLKQLPKFFNSGKECGFSGYDFEGFYYQKKPFKPLNRTFESRSRRQDKKSIWIEDGGFYIFSREILNQKDMIWTEPFLFDGFAGVDIHTIDDLYYAQKLWSTEWLR